MFAPYAAVLVRVSILPLVTPQQRSSLLLPFSSLFNTSTTTRLFYKHLEFRESQSSLDFFTGCVFVSPTVASTNRVCSVSDPLTLPKCFVTPGRVHLSIQSTHHNPDIGEICESPTYQLRQLLHSAGAMFYSDNDIYTLHQSQPLQAILHFQASTTFPGETFIVSIVHKSLRKKSTFLKLRQLFVAALIFGAARDSKGPIVDTSALSETILCHVTCAR
ncbi:hypothetical protein V8C40DRAFT_65408 [Trichoderma camerunense]